MNKKILVIFGCCLILAGCSTGKGPCEGVAKPQNVAATNNLEANNTNDGAYTALANAATSVNQSITELGETAQAAYPPVSVSEPPAPSSYGMNIPITIDWNGPIQPLVKQIADQANYQLRVLGQAPAIPVVVSISAENTPIGDILRDAGYQAANRADVVVFPSTHVIELRYTKP